MIKGISQNGRYMMVSGGSPSSTYYQNGQPMSGMTRFYNNNLEVYDGNMWQQISNSYATVGLTPDAENAISWALDKMAEERKIIELAKTNNAVKLALDNLNKAKEQLTITTILAEEHEQTTS